VLRQGSDPVPDLAGQFRQPVLWPTETGPERRSRQWRHVPRRAADSSKRSPGSWSGSRVVGGHDRDQHRGVPVGIGPLGFGPAATIIRS